MNGLDYTTRYNGNMPMLSPAENKKLKQSGANAAISGDMLTTSGMTIEKDMVMIKELGFEVRAMEQ